MPKLILYLIPILALPIALGGCPVAIVGGIAAAGGAGYAANQERGVGGVAGDFTIKTNIQNAWLQANPKLQGDIGVTVYEGRALLTGKAPTPEMKAEAQQLASGVKGVRAVYNEIEVAPSETVWSSAKDAWITSQVRSGLIFNSQHPLGQLYGRDGRPVGLSDRFGPQPGRTRRRNQRGAICSGGEAGGLLRGNSARRTGRRRPGGIAGAAAGRRAEPRCGDRCADDPGRGPKALTELARADERTARNR